MPGLEFVTARAGPVLGPPLVIAWYVHPGNTSRDILRIEVWDGTLKGFSHTKAEVCIAMEHPVTWEKETVAWGTCSPHVKKSVKITTQGTRQCMVLDRGNCFAAINTLVFRKPGWFGIWHDVTYFDLNRFWLVFGGKVVHFTWVRD